MKITELSSFEELNLSDTSLISGGITISRSIELSGAAASYLIGTDVDGGTYTVTYEDGQISDEIFAVRNDGFVGAFARSGIFF